MLFLDTPPSLEGPFVCLLCADLMSYGRNFTVGYQFLLLNFVTKGVLLTVVTFDDQHFDYLCVHVRVCVHIWMPEIKLGIIPPVLFTLFLETVSFSGLDLTKYAGLGSLILRELPIFSWLILSLEVLATTPVFVCLFLCF